MANRMSFSTLSPYHPQVERKNPSKKEEIMTIMNNLKAEDDVLIMIDDLSPNKELSDGSSVYLVIPPDSDNSENSTTCIQLSQYTNNWKDIWEEELASAQRDLHGLKISSKGRNYFMKGLPPNLLSSADQEAMFNEEPTIIYRNREETKNKLCQITTPDAMVQLVKHQAVGTDTTDRPCCCLPRPQKKSDNRANSRSVACGPNEFIRPTANPGVENARPRCVDITQQHSRTGLSGNCRVPTCRGQSDCHTPPTPRSRLVAEDFKRIPYGFGQPSGPSTNRQPSGGCRVPPCRGYSSCNSPDSQMSTQFGGGGNNAPCGLQQSRNESQGCRVPSSAGHVYCHTNSTHMSNNIQGDCNSGAHNIVNVLQPQVGGCRVPTCRGQAECHSPTRSKPRPTYVYFPDQLLKVNQECQYEPEEKDIAAKTLILKGIACGGSTEHVVTVNRKMQQKNMDPKSKSTKHVCESCNKTADACGCWTDKKKGKKLRKMCACERYQPIISEAENGPKKGTRSFGSDKDNYLFAITLVSLGIQTEPSGPLLLLILGAAGGYAKIEKDGAYTQAGLPNKDCTCKTGKKRKKLRIETSMPDICPGKTTPGSPCFSDSWEDLPYYDLYADQKYNAKLRSDLTQTTSGFKFYKKKKIKPTEVEPEYSFEDAIMSYAKLNPEIFAEVVCPGGANPCVCEEDNTPTTKPKSAPKLLERLSFKKSSPLGSPKGKADKDDVLCKCPDFVPPTSPEVPPTQPPIVKHSAPKTSDVPFNEAPGTNIQQEEEEEEEPLKGFKFTIGGKGSSSKGLAGICCFDVVEERFASSMSWAKMESLEVKWSRSTSMDLDHVSLDQLEPQLSTVHCRLSSEDEQNYSD